MRFLSWLLVRVVFLTLAMGLFYMLQAIPGFKEAMYQLALWLWMLLALLWALVAWVGMVVLNLVLGLL